jgi:cell division GTPase FtsZ
MIQTNKPLHLIGFGGAGSNMIIALQKMGLPAKYTCITQPERENLAPKIAYINFMPAGEQRITKTGKEFFIPDMQAPVQVSQNIYSLFKPEAHYVLIAGLGGYTGTYLMEHFGTWLPAHQISFTAICVMPFSFERAGSKTIIKRIQKKFKDNKRFHFIELDTYQEKFGDKPLQELFEQVNEEVYSLSVKC